MNQKNLFDQRFPDYRSDANKAIAQVQENANPDWNEEAWEEFMDIARTNLEFTSNNVTVRMKSSKAKTHDARAIGPIMLKAARARIIEKTGRYAPGAYGHGKPTPIWRSLIYTGEKK